MHHVLRHVLSPLLAGTLGAVVLVNAAAWSWVPWTQAVAGTLGVVLASALWWAVREGADAWGHTLATILLATAFAAFIAPFLALSPPGDFGWIAGFGVFVTAMGAYSLAPSPPAAAVWLTVLGIPSLWYAGGRWPLAAGAFVLWFLICWLRYRSLKTFANAWLAVTLKDPVTNLEHRRAFETKLGALLDGLPGTPAFVGTLSIDRLKELNQAFGQAYGDHLLQAVAQRISSELQPNESATRIAGSDIALAVAGPLARAEAIVNRVRGVYALGGHRTVVGISSGWAPLPEPGTKPDVWLAQARMALAASWERGGNRLSVYDEGMERQTQLRLRRTDELEMALANNEFFVVFQPQFDPHSGQTVGAEALVRWQHPVDGVIAPLEFIPLAEETGLITSLGNWILETALKQAAQWPPQWSVAINVSARQLGDPTFPSHVWRALTRHGVDARRLTLEITESVLIEEGDRVDIVLESFRAGGIRISLDDFGTGYSSLLYLRNYPLDEIKVDQRFVRSIEDHRQSSAIVETVLRLATTLGIETTAEGVENQEQADILRTFGCTRFQGYHFSPPVRDPRNPGVAP